MNLLIIVFTKLLVGLLKLFKRGSGTALPGLVAQKLNPNILSDLIKNIPIRVVITGTNGKTTTQSLLKTILTDSGMKVLNNGAGANLARGLVSELIKRSDNSGKLNYDIAVLEVEEATLPKIIDQIQPQYIIVTNIYRDQLDAYGEIDTTQRYIRKAIEKCPDAKLVLNGDDPRVRYLADLLNNEYNLIQIDSNFATEIIYEKANARTEQVELKEANQIVTAKNIKINEDLSSTFNIEIKEELVMHDLNLKVPGFFHIYNFLYAYFVSKDLEIDDKHILNSLDKFNSAFGRGEIIRKDNKDIRLLLVKNPTALSLNLSLLRNISELNLLIAINDKIADGRDISWLWDSLIEILNKTDIKTLTISGTRCYDMALRIKYATEQNSKLKEVDILVENDLGKALGFAMHKTKDQSTLYILPTYTAMLEIRGKLGLRLE